ncbi:unnamed protein product [Brachionus calyciflorus]|uniref:HD/PDEase domain-containing protein n=1 Tax=Brachionus calyciflorus TaxID=104777 RepID=A0A814F6Y5_9BILA|nr:unnamed protein product [Brachionus calyciflorus]
MVVENLNLIEEAKNFSRNFMQNNDPSHDWNHVERVYKNAMFLIEQEKKLNENLVYDLEVIQLAALFHDIIDFKYDHDKSKSLDQIAQDRLGEFFSRFNLSMDKQEQVLHIILNISWRKELEMGQKSDRIPIELKIVRDADRLDAIGAVGVARCMAFSGAKNRPIYIEGVEPIHNMTAEQYNNQTIKNESTAINHFYEKLLLIKDKMQTQTGKKMALERHEFMLQYLNQFDTEIKL